MVRAQTTNGWPAQKKTILQHSGSFCEGPRSNATPASARATKDGLYEMTHAGLRYEQVEKSTKTFEEALQNEKEHVQDLFRKTEFPVHWE